jgi:hypothetical protein
MNNNIEPIPTQNPWAWATNRGCHTTFFSFSENGEWRHGTLSLNGRGPILGDWRMENVENFFSSTGEEWRMEKTSRGRFYYFSTWGCFFHPESTLQKVRDG